MTNRVLFKADCNRAHAISRAAERYGIDLMPADLMAFEGTIRRGDAPRDCVPLRPSREDPDRIWYAVRHCGLWLPVVYDMRTVSIVTVLPDHTLDPYRRMLDTLAAALPHGKEKTT